MRIVAVTACPSGVAHTYMAAEALQKAGEKKGYWIKVETQGSIGLENKLTPEDVSSADVVILTKDMAIKHRERFSGKKVINIGIGDAIKKADALMEKLAQMLSQES